MRIINIDLSQDAHCSQKIFGGYAREHNETQLVVKLPERMIRTDISYYYIEFQTILGEHIVSPSIYINELIDGSKISITLWEQLIPSAGDLSFCVTAVNLAQDDTITIKGKSSPCTLQILKSPTGENTLIDISSTKEDLQKAIDEAIKNVDLSDEVNSRLETKQNKFATIVKYDNDSRSIIKIDGIGVLLNINTLTEANAELGIAASDLPYQATSKDYVDNLIGAISTALDNILAIQNAYIGGVTT